MSCGLFALENVRDREGEAAILIHNIVCVTHQSAALDEYANGIHRRAVTVPQPI